MKFDFQYYKDYLFKMPLYYVLGLILGFVFLLVNQQFVFFESVFPLIILMPLFCSNIFKLKYGFLILLDNERDCIKKVSKIIKISTIKTPFPHNYKYFKKKYNNISSDAVMLVLEGLENKLYLMSNVGLIEGDVVEVFFLPKSKIVLEIYKI